MDLKELHSFKLSDAVTFHDQLNPKLFRGQHLQPEVELQLKTIAQDFLQEMGIHDLDVRDITISGSNAAYSYTDHSDLDLHILVNMDDLPNDEIYREFFKAKKDLYNDSHDIKINGIPVELYIQDAAEPVVSLGEYSIKDKKWLRLPTKRRANFDQTATKAKYEKLLDVIDTALQSKKLSKVNKILKKIKQYRQAGLDKGGEFGPENLAYKALRSQGYITDLYDLRDKLHSKHLSLNGMYSNPVDEDYDPNGVPPGPEFKPTMPAGTVKVDVSDVYDWYKLGQHISDLEHADPKMFGKGPPSTIMAFGSEPEEHKYIERLKKLGLTTTDVDPLDPNQPKGMPRQSVDPTYNVNETSDEEISNYSKLDKVLVKLCNMVIKGQDSDKDYGMVAACVIDPDNNAVARLNYLESKGKRVHAERAAIEAYENKYGEVPAGSIVVTTLSPCNESNDETADGRVGESCTDYLNSKGIKKVYCGYTDPTQDNDNRDFNIIETSDKGIRKECKSFADTFLNDVEQSVNEIIDMPPVTRRMDIQSMYDDMQRKMRYHEASQLTPINFPMKNKIFRDEKYGLKFFLLNNENKPVFYLGISKFHDGFKTGVVAGEREVQGQGLGWKLYKAVSDYLGVPLYSDSTQTSDSKKGIWQKLIDNYPKQVVGYEQISRKNVPINNIYQTLPQDELKYVDDDTRRNTLLLKFLPSVIQEASGYIPSEKEKNDPRFKTALTVDVKPDSIKKNAKSFYWKTSRAGIPPTANPSGKF